jgi:transcriptional regulator
MYIPKHFELTDHAVMFNLMRQHGFATIVSTHDGVPFATHMPVTVKPDLGTLGILRTHVARANPQWQHLDANRELLVIFQGDHSYVSPRFYEQHPQRAHLE